MPRLGRVWGDGATAGAQEARSFRYRFCKSPVLPRIQFEQHIGGFFVAPLRGIDGGKVNFGVATRHFFDHRNGGVGLTVHPQELGEIHVISGYQGFETPQVSLKFKCLFHASCGRKPIAVRLQRIRVVGI